MVLKKAKFRVGQKVTSYQNRKSPARINRVNQADKGTPYSNTYRLSLKGRNSKWINEESLKKQRLAKPKRRL